MSLYIPNFYSQDNKIFNDFSLAEHHENNPDNITIVIIIDALSDDFFRSNNEKTPNLNKLISNGAFYFKNTTCIPSCTGIGHTHILTGVGPDEHNIAGLNFLNREKQEHFNGLDLNVEQLLNNGLSKEINTIFEGNSDIKSASIWNPVSRGATISIPYSQSFYRHAERLAMKQIDEGARVLTIWYPLLDPIGHYLGVEHPFRKFWLYRIDYQIGLLLKSLENRNLLDKTMLHITADHGQTMVNKKFDLFDYFRKYGLKTYGKDHITEKDPKIFNNYDIFVCRNGYRFAHVYFGDNMKAAPKLINYFREQLLTEDAVRNIFSRVGDSVLVESKNGTAIIHQNNEKYSYKVVQGIDPLLYEDSFLKNGQFLSEDNWKDSTIYSESPNVVPQIYQLMIAKNSGDITLAASKEYNFSSIPHKAGHGGLEKEEMIVPSISLFPESSGKRSKIKVLTPEERKVC
jgi:Uncharacterized proteins of the AP superfamily